MPKQEQRINRKEEKALLKPTWPMLLGLTTRGKDSTGNVVFSASVGRLPFASFQKKFELRIPKKENIFKAGQVFQAPLNS